METIRHVKAVLSPSQWSLLLTALAISLWAFSLTQAKLNLDGYGLIHSYPITFFIALGFLTVASAILWVSHENHSKLLFLQLVFLIVSLWLTPVLIGGLGNSQPVLPDAFYDYGNSEYIIRQGHFLPDVLWRHYWPGTFIVVSSLVNVSGITNPDTMVGLFPIVSQMLFLIPLCTIFKNIVSKNKNNYHWVMLWIFYLGSWGSYGLLHTQTVANLIALTLIAVLTGPQHIQTTVTFSLESILLFASLIMTHLFTSLYAILSIIALTILKVIKNPLFIAVTIVLLSTYLFYMAGSYLQINLPTTLKRIFNLSLLWSANVETRVVGNPTHQFIVQIRMMTTVLFALIACVGFVISRKEKSENRTKMIALSISIILVLIGMGSSYNESGLQRLYFFALLPIAYFCVFLLSRRTSSIVLVCLLIIAIPLHIISHYGNQEIDYASPSTIASWHFIPDKTKQGIIVSESEYGITNNLERYSTFSLGRIEQEFNTAFELPNEYPQYVYITEQDKTYFSVLYNDPNFIIRLKSQLDNQNNYNLVYVNPDSEIYFSDGKQ